MAIAYEALDRLIDDSKRLMIVRVLLSNNQSSESESSPEWSCRVLLLVSDTKGRWSGMIEFNRNDMKDEFDLEEGAWSSGGEMFTQVLESSRDERLPTIEEAFNVFHDKIQGFYWEDSSVEQIAIYVRPYRSIASRRGSKCRIDVVQHLVRIQSLLAAKALELWRQESAADIDRFDEFKGQYSNQLCFFKTAATRLDAVITEANNELRQMLT